MHFPSLLLALPTLLLVACGTPPAAVPPSPGPGGSSTPPPSETPVEHRSIEAIWKAQCATCHLLVQPGTHGRAALAEALQPHRKRVKLTEEQWGQMVDFLAQK